VPGFGGEKKTRSLLEKVAGKSGIKMSQKITRDGVPKMGVLRRVKINFQGGKRRESLFKLKDLFRKKPKKEKCSLKIAKRESKEESDEEGGMKGGGG